MRALLLAGLLVLGTTPLGAGEPSLYERNLALLQGVIPADATIEVQVVEDGVRRTHLWTGAQFAQTRAHHAALMGLDYTTGFQGAPAGMGDRQDIGDIWADLWGSTPTVNLALGRGLPRSVPIDDKFWIYGGATTDTGALESSGDCAVLFFGFAICDAIYGWSGCQCGSTVGDSWHAGTGTFLLFPAPFGGMFVYNGAAFSETT
jgi:hypothetical protein